MKMFFGGNWVDRQERIEVRNPFDNSLVDTVPSAEGDDVEAALQGAVEGARVMRGLPAYQRSQVLRRAADLIHQRREELARLISNEEGKILAESRGEVARAVETIELSAEEAKRLSGELLPLDGAPGGHTRLGFTLRVPCGVVVAISPFNFPLNLVCHKVGPALAAGNSVIIKPSTDTPLSALRLVEILLEAGLPPLGVACLTGSGSTLGKTLCGDPRVRKITFTGSRDVGEQICRTAGIKRLTMELGSNSPVIVMPDANLDKVAAALVATGYANAGQVCISAQRVLALEPIYEPLIESLGPRVAALRSGDPLDEATQISPLIRQQDAERVRQWIEEAVGEGARLVTGGGVQGNFVEPAVLADVDPRMKISRLELFGPAVGLTRCHSIDEAIALANDTPFGLSAGIFTENLNWAIKYAREVECGNLHINWGPQWRADLMPYGGLKESGFGKEGPKYAVEEMTELKTVIIHGN